MAPYLRWRLLELFLLLAIVVLPGALFADLPAPLAARLASSALALALLAGYMWAGRKADHARPAAPVLSPIGRRRLFR